MTLFWIIVVAALAFQVFRLTGRVNRLEGSLEAVTRTLGSRPTPVLGESRPDNATDLVESVAASAKAEDNAAETDDAADGPWAEAARTANDETPAKTDDIAAVAAVSSAQPAAKAEGIETALGTKWAVWVGGLALAFGGLFLVRYSIEAGWFGPAARLSMAAAFGLVLLGIGEFVRRTGFKVPVQGLDIAYVPSILTAAGAFTLFGAVYAAHGVYGFIGPGLAFTLLGLVALATMALALIHGQSIAGLGLLGALATPMLVASDSPNPWFLFGYLAVVLAAAVAIARIRLWPLLAAAAQAGVGLWALFYIVAATPDGFVVLFITTVMVALLALVWLREQQGIDLMSRVGVPAITVAIFGTMIAIALAVNAPPGSAPFAAAILVVMLAAAAWRADALPLLHGAGSAAVLMLLPSVDEKLSAFAIAPESYIQMHINALWPAGWMLFAAFLLAGLFMARRTIAASPVRAAQWAGWASLVPVVVTASYWALYGTLDIDYLYAAIAFALMFTLAASVEWLARREEPSLTGGYAVSALLAGSGAAAVIGLHAALSPVWTTTMIGLAAAIPALVTRWRNYPALGWLAVAAFVVTTLRIAYDPSLVWFDPVSTMPSYAVLLQGYGLPALAFAYCAWQLARTTDSQPRLVMEVAACLFVMLTAAVLVRRAMSGGDFYADELRLAEQAIYTLIALGAGGSLIAIGQRSPSVVMTYGSMALGVISTALAALLHFGLLNPLFTDESTGKIPVLNLLFLAYLLPAVGAAAVALYARGKRPPWYSSMLGLLAALLAFAYLTLSVRRWYQGEFIGIWRDTTQLETYSYSALWLVFGVILLVIGVRLQSYVLRVASAALIAIAVIKVFLLDMAALEGVLRALSFIGLGAVLIGIGLFYQRLLAIGVPKPEAATPPAPAQDGPPAPR